MTKLANRADTLLADLADNNPAPQETVFARDWFDPMHGLTELRYAAKKGLVTIVESGSTPSRFRFLITEKGRAYASDNAKEATPADLSPTQVKVRELLDDLAFENPTPVEKWVEASNFETMHDATEIRYAAQRGWIELDGKSDGREQLRMRLTEKGRHRLAEIAPLSCETSSATA
ncbi:MAG: hypothetical protein DI533_21660 [Cereibacter sphaeroides]|uniref:Uncharacterized protein n=1 Tax=Cereibacter sphaeroides TaxID=1063 RepID=A0A2W5RVZ7_CERSP|nr:MAG: hypothetical protein DI533_21660 [Cereibacter sphaeroides]